MRCWLSALLLVPLIACGGTGVSPSPVPSPVPVPLPAPAPAPAQPPLVQPDPARFDATFNAQLVHDAYDHPGALQPSILLQADPSVYLQAAGLSAATVAALEHAARVAIPALSGDLRHVAAFETGATLRPDAVGWIVVEIVNDDAQPCGRTFIGAAAGHSWLNIIARCQFGGFEVDPPLFAHEIGHAVGFFHVAEVGHLMHPRATFTERRSIEPSDTERYHAALAYQSHGAYAARGSVFTQRIVVVD